MWDGEVVVVVAVVCCDGHDVGDSYGGGYNGDVSRDGGGHRGGDCHDGSHRCGRSHLAGDRCHNCQIENNFFQWT